MAERTKPQGMATANDARSKAKPQGMAKAEADARLKAKPTRPSEPKYALPLPVRTFPLPAFYPSNPLSLAHLAVAWLAQLLRPPPPEPVAAYTGVWSPATRSVHVTDPHAMHALWCQGFFGKGSLSRSEPSWLNREKARRGLVHETSEQRTAKRREERADTKWQRGRTELEAIEQRRVRELEVEKAAAAAAATVVVAAELVMPAAIDTKEPTNTKPDVSVPYTVKAPVGPLELLALPNSQAELLQLLAACKSIGDSLVSDKINESSPEIKPPVGPLELLALPNSQVELLVMLAAQKSTASIGPEMGPPASNDTNSSTATPLFSDNEGSSESPTPPCVKPKSVRFSPTIESTTFQHSDPPSRNLAAASPSRDDVLEDSETKDTEIQNKEHLQLSAEEAFFLAYALGTLEVRDPAADNAVLSTEQLFRLFRQHSYFPPRTGSADQLALDDPFLVHYAVYHHFRALGWVPRHGIKFGVDWLLYGKGPALDHAPFGVVVVPSYGGAYDEKSKKTPVKSWHWLHSVNRVLTTVYKSMVIVYVDIPAPGTGAESATALLQRYKIREVMVRRWSSNRNRD